MFKTNLKTIKKITITAMFALVLIPTLAFAGTSGMSGGYSWNPSSGSNLTGWGGSSTGYNYSPVYSYSAVRPTQTFVSAPTYSSFVPSSFYNSSYFGGGWGGSFGVPAFTSGFTPSSGATRVENRNTNTNTAIASSSATAINNVYIYTNPSGNAVVNNPQHQFLNVYCTITPSNPRLGQTVTATAYATGGIGNYTYTWGGDINQTSGPSTVFTSYTTGTKNITVTVRSGQEIITRSCDVTFVNDNQNNNNDLSAVCFANPTNATVNQIVTWTVNVNGGNGPYSFNWSGTDGLSGFNQFISRQYSSTGLKNAFVTVTSSNGRSVIASCSTNVNSVLGTSFTGGSSVNLTPNITSGTPVSGVFLGDLPSTGLSMSFVNYMIGFMTLILALVFTFVYQARKRLMAENI